MPTETASLVFKADTSDLREAHGELDGVAGAGNKAQKSLDNVARESRDASSGLNKASASAKSTAANLKLVDNSAQRASKGMGGARRAAGQLGFQVQDVAVQLQSGQNAMLVLGQQGSQVASIFGPGGAVIGALLAVGAALATAFAPALFESAGENVDELADQIKELNKEYSTLTIEQKAFLAGVEADKIDEYAQSLESTKEAVDNVKASITNHLTTQQRYNDMIAAGVNPTLDMIRANENSKARVVELEAELRALNAKLSTTGQRTSAAETEIKKLNGEVEDTGVKADGATKSLERYISALETRAALIGKSESEKIEFQVRAQGGTDEDVARAQAATAKLAEEKRLQASLDSLAKEDAASNAFYERRSQAASAHAAHVALINETAEERAVRRNEESLARLEDEFSRKLISETEYLTAKEALHIDSETRLQEAVDKMRVEAIEKRNAAAAAERDQKEQITSQMLYLEDRLLEGKSKTAVASLQIAKNLATAEGRENAKKIISGSYDAGMKAYQSLAVIPVVGPALGAAAAAAIIASGVAWSAKSLAGRALGGQTLAGESYIVGERGPEVLTMGASNGRIIPNEKLSQPAKAQAEQPVQVSFNISANDSRGFDELILERRGLITGIMADAMHEAGRVA